MQFSYTATAAVFSVAVAIAGIIAYKQFPPGRETHRYEEFAEPEKDADRTAEVRNFSLRGAYGIAIDIPGINGDYYILSAKFAIAVIEGTSDVISDYRNDYNNVARRYAFRFNRRMFQILGCDFDRPMEPCKNY